MNAGACGADGSKCVDGDQVYKDMKVNEAKLVTLPALIVKYKAARLAYTTAYD